MTPERFKSIRLKLGLSQRGAASLLRMGKHGYRNVQRWEYGVQDIPGWAALVWNILESGELPDLMPYRRLTNAQQR